MPTVAIYTLGCKVSQYESEAILEAFSEHGVDPAPPDTPADIYVINTCTVTAESDRKCRQTIRRAISQSPNAVIAVCGCYSQRASAELAAIDGVDIVIGTDNKLTVVPLCLEYLSGKRAGQYISAPSLEGAKFEKMCVRGAPRTRAYVKIEDGCESRCSYCAIRHARGPVRSKPPAEVIAEVEGLYRSGTREIVLTGIETGSYGRDLDGSYTLADLIVELDKRGSCERLRLGSLAPELVGRDFVDKVKDCKILVPHFHLSMQSGSDTVLRLMRRRYSAAMASETVERFRAAIPDVQFTTDLMVGFPGESEECFLETLAFVERARFLDAHVFVYSEREGTEAPSLPDPVPKEERRRRAKRLCTLVRRIRDEILDGVVSEKKLLSSILESYEDGHYSAHSDEFIALRVAAPENMQGERVWVVPVSHKNGIVEAVLAGNNITKSK